MTTPLLLRVQGKQKFVYEIKNSTKIFKFYVSKVAQIKFHAIEQGGRKR